MPETEAFLVLEMPVSLNFSNQLINQFWWVEFSGWASPRGKVVPMVTMCFVVSGTSQPVTPYLFDVLTSASQSHGLEEEMSNLVLTKVYSSVAPESERTESTVSAPPSFITNFHQEWMALIVFQTSNPSPHVILQLQQPSSKSTEFSVL
jgi:hypothetical protein